MTHATSHDNRSGDDSHPFGFVYFDDGRRIAYAEGFDPSTMGTGGWDEISFAHVQNARA
jgi:hypothetical protein